MLHHPVEDGLHVDDWSAVDGLERAHSNPKAIDRDDGYAMQADRVGAIW